MPEKVMGRILGLVLCAFVLLSCGNQHKAESKVKEFLGENLKTEDYSVEFSKVGQTRTVTDSVIDAMITRAHKNNAYKSNMKLGDKQRHDTLMYVKGRIVMGKDTLVQTFYLTPDMKHVVAFKEN